MIPVLQDAVGAAQRIGSGTVEVLARVELTNTLLARGRYEAAIRAGGPMLPERIGKPEPLKGDLSGQ